MNNKILRQLKNVDWDFICVDPGATRPIHWYPGTFPSQLPATLIEALSDRNDIVFDPYGGIGTSSAEAIRLGRKAWSFDNNPVSFLASYVIGGLLILKADSIIEISSVFSEIREVLLEQQKQPEPIRKLLYNKKINAENILQKQIRPKPDYMEKIYLTKLTPNWNLLEKWVELTTLKKIIDTIDRLKKCDLMSFSKLIALTMVSAVLRPSSSQTKSWGHIADNVYPKEFVTKDFTSLCRRWLTRTENVILKIDMGNIIKKRDNSIKLWVNMHNWLDKSIIKHRPQSKAKLLITSPPYAGAIDYTRGHRLSLYLFGYSEEELTKFGEQEIGARRKRFNPDSKLQWAEELAEAVSSQLELVDETGNIAIILPHKDHGREAGSNYLYKTLNMSGWKRYFVADRSIRQIRTRQSWTSIKRETIEIYCK